MSDPRFEPRNYVQHFLNQNEGRELVIIMQKLDGSQRKLVGTLDPKAKRLSTVPIQTPDGWRSFSLERVLYISTTGGSA